jgi:hypothetical protein
MLVHGQQAELDVIGVCNRAAGPMFKHLTRREILQEIAASPAGYNRHAFASFLNTKTALILAGQRFRQRHNALCLVE